MNAPLVTLLALADPGLHFLDVGQGSALLVVEPGGRAIMVDSGPAGAAEAVLAALREHEIEEVALWVHTHWDADHVGGFSRVVAGEDGRHFTEDDIEVVSLWDRGFAGAPATDAVITYALLAGQRRSDVSDGSTMTLGEAHVWSVPLERGALETENHRGLALCVTVAGTRLLAPGDLPAATAERAADACGRADVLWASHHGSADGISPELVQVADPDVVIVSAGRENAYCHPSPVTLGALSEREVWITHAAGVSPRGACEPIAGILGPRHRIVGEGVWLPLHAR